jgi:hypothetical protein
MRDDFTRTTRDRIAKLAGWRCSFPGCAVDTVGSNSDGSNVIDIGTAAHICAASPGGPRYNPAMTAEERRSASNGIWMCRDHGKAIDTPDPIFTVAKLREWKRAAEQASMRRVLRGEVGAQSPPPVGSAAAALASAARADLDVFRQTTRWPATNVSLTLQVDGLDEPASTASLAVVAATLDDLLLVAPPGMGKTTTLFQLAEGMVKQAVGIPIIVPLGDWATDTASIINSILARGSYRAVTEAQFREAVGSERTVLLLDGWNELDAASRERARVQLFALKAELPKLAFVIATRRQTLDVPFPATRVDLLPLGDQQQLAIAEALGGAAGVRTLDTAWRTSGIRELVTIPLYLTALLKLSVDSPFPETKEELLRQFVAEQEDNARRAEALQPLCQGMHAHYLTRLAEVATAAGQTSLADASARQVVARMQEKLVSEGQVALLQQPAAILDSLVSNHVLLRSPDAAGYAFQHQQFQEWYASQFVEQQLFASLIDTAARERLSRDIFNARPWEEAVLFAVERVSRADEPGPAACAAAILAAFDVDPMLAAEMIYRASDAVWVLVEPRIAPRVRRWHQPGHVDRALGFMMLAGRSEFLDLVWPLLSDENTQVHLPAARAGTGFRTSILGADALARIASLPVGPRRNLLHEIAASAGMDGLDLATEAARLDKDEAVKMAVVDGLAFRRADAHLARVLQTADDRVFDHVARSRLIEHLSDAKIQTRLERAQTRLNKGKTPADYLHALILAPEAPALASQIADAVVRLDLSDERDRETRLVWEAQRRFPVRVAEAMLDRLRKGLPLVFRAEEIVGAAGLAREDEWLAKLALEGDERRDQSAVTASAALGPLAAGEMVDAYLDAGARMRTPNGSFDKPWSDRFHALRDRLAQVPGLSLAAAVAARAEQQDLMAVERLARLLARRGSPSDGSIRQLEPGAREIAVTLVRRWSAQALAADIVPQRSALAALASLIGSLSEPALLPELEGLLDTELRLWKAFRDTAQAEHWQGPARNEASWSHTGDYQRALFGMSVPGAREVAIRHLDDPLFAGEAARLLALQWETENQPETPGPFRPSPDFSHVAVRRTALVADPSLTCSQSEAILAVVERLVTEECDTEALGHALSLAIVAARLPHGNRTALFNTLLDRAPANPRADLLLGLVLSGEVVSADRIFAGIADLVSTAQEKQWLLMDSSHWEWRRWLILLPFSDDPSKAIALLDQLPESLRNVRFLDDVVGAFTFAPSPKAETVLLAWAERVPGLYANHAWKRTLLARGTETAARAFIDLAAAGKIKSNSGGAYWIAEQIGPMFDRFPPLRTYVEGLLGADPAQHGAQTLAQALGANLDIDGLLLLLGRPEPWRYIHRLNGLERLLTRRIEVGDWTNTFEIVPVDATELRRTLLARTSDGGADDWAAWCLREIDEIRDDYGAPDNEPRHPDLASGKPWPIISR